MGFARHHELDRSLVRCEQSEKTIGLGQQECGSLVGGEAASEDDGERVGVECGADPFVCELDQG